MVTVLSHFYNEEYLLPWWLKQHKKIFDHGILVNYNSTDRSVEIIKEICPTWQIVDSENSEFCAVSCDQEIMKLENEIPGYKICLNTTEMLVKNKYTDEDKKLEDYLSRDQSCYPIIRANIVDENPLIEVTHEDDLIEIKNYGVLGSVGLHPPHRYLHNHPNGQYGVGRHYVSLPLSYSDIPYTIYWYGFAPWNEKLISRKTQIKDKIPAQNKLSGMGYQHFWDNTEMENFRLSILKNATKLR